MKKLMAGLVFIIMNYAQAEVVRVDVRPSTTAPEIKAADVPHIVLVDSSSVGPELLLWMPGTSH